MTRIKNPGFMRKPPFDVTPNQTEKEMLDRIAELHRHEQQAAQVMRRCKAERMSLKDRLKKIRYERSNARVTDHAILRYLERVEGIDLVKIEKELEAQIPEGTRHKDVDIEINGIKLTAIVRENHIVTLRRSELEQEDE